MFADAHDAQTELIGQLAFPDDLPNGLRGRL
jgi:hypothetical protein